jgi:hypothetical protein
VQSAFAPYGFQYSCQRPHAELSLLLVVKHLFYPDAAVSSYSELPKDERIAGFGQAFLHGSNAVKSTVFGDRNNFFKPVRVLREKFCGQVFQLACALVNS